MSALTHVYVVNAECYDDFQAQGVVGVFTSREAVERIYGPFLWDDVPFKNAANLVAQDDGNYCVYYLPLDVAPDW